MLVAEESWLKLVFRPRPEAVAKLAPRIFVVLVITIVATVGFTRAWYDLHLSVVPFTLVGLPLGIFIGFRGNRAYERYWEARTLWGNLVNATRTLARQTCHLIDASEDERPEVEALQQAVVWRVITFCYALRGHLAGTLDRAELAAHLGEEPLPPASEQNLPQAIARELTPHLRQAVKRGWLDPFHLPDLEMGVTRMTDVQGACERIKNTPLPVPFTALTHRLVALYCVCLPFGLVETLSWMTIPVTMFITYAFLGLEGISEEIERPFAPGPNQLPLLTMCKTIDLNLRQTLAETADLPQIPVASRGVQP